VGRRSGALAKPPLRGSSRFLARASWVGDADCRGRARRRREWRRRPGAGEESAGSPRRCVGAPGALLARAPPRGCDVRAIMIVRRPPRAHRRAAPARAVAKVASGTRCPSVTTRRVNEFFRALLDESMTLKLGCCKSVLRATLEEAQEAKIEMVWQCDASTSAKRGQALMCSTVAGVI